MSELIDQDGLEISPETLQYLQKGGSSSGNRQADTSPFYGGDAIHGPQTQVLGCTGNFGVRSSVNVDYLMTAYHCVKPADLREWTDNANAWIGRVTAINKALDLAFIRTDQAGAAVSPLVFSGTHGQSDQDTQIKSVIGYQAVNAGDYVCTDGARSYARCNVVRVGTGRTWTSTNGYSGEQYATSGSDIYSTDGSWIWGHGDSGGPILYLVSLTQVRAYGLISAQYDSGTTACGNWMSTTCTNDGLFVPADSIVAAQNVHFNW